VAMEGFDLSHSENVLWAGIEHCAGRHLQIELITTSDPDDAFQYGHMVESADSSLERVVRVHVVLADISHMAEWIACSANSSQSIRRRVPRGPCSCASATAA
jgi:hypothetical protein